MPFLLDRLRSGRLALASTQASDPLLDGHNLETGGHKLPLDLFQFLLDLLAACLQASQRCLVSGCVHIPLRANDIRYRPLGFIGSRTRRLQQQHLASTVCMWEIPPNQNFLHVFPGLMLPSPLKPEGPAHYVE